MNYLGKSCCALALPVTIGIGEANAQLNQYRDDNGLDGEMAVTKNVAGVSFDSPFGVGADVGYDGKNAYVKFGARLSEFDPNDCVNLYAGWKPLKTKRASIGAGLWAGANPRYRNAFGVPVEKGDEEEFYSNAMNMKGGLKAGANVRGHFNSKALEADVGVGIPFGDFLDPVVLASARKKLGDFKIRVSGKYWNPNEGSAEATLAWNVLNTLKSKVAKRYTQRTGKDYDASVFVRGTSHWGLIGYDGHMENMEVGLCITGW